MVRSVLLRGGGACEKERYDVDAWSREGDMRCHPCKREKPARAGADVPLPGHAYTLPVLSFLLLAPCGPTISPFCVLFIDSDTLDAYQGSSAHALLSDLWYDKLLTVGTASWRQAHLMGNRPLAYSPAKGKGAKSPNLCFKSRLIRLETTGIEVLNKQASIFFSFLFF